MNATFNLKRFLLLERYGKQETGRHILQTAGVILGICLLCMMYDINRGGSLYDHQTQGAFIWRYVMWFLCAAPCILEKNITKDSSTTYLLLPASTFEKFLHLWIKYYVLLPVLSILLLSVLKGIFALTGIEFLQHFGNAIMLHEVHKDQIMFLCLLQGIFFASCIAFKQKKLLKAFGAFCLSILLCFGIVGLLSLIIYHGVNDSQRYWMNSIISFPTYNFPVSSAAEAIVNFCNYAAPAAFIIGIWISSYFLLKEKQL
ncbi:MAG: hypothetical protein LUF01_14895 [Bacteroides sp.]|nr:hypothetical protein [Bacteroides sp.]